MSEFDGMTDRESVAHQLKRWVDGKPLHNTVRDECCPDFSCCNGLEMSPIEVRERFAKAHNEGNTVKTDIMSLSLLSGAFSDTDVYVAGEDQTEH